jgi:hypothetical protein
MLQKKAKEVADKLGKVTKREQHLKASVLFVLSPATEKTNNSRYSCIVDRADHMSTQYRLVQAGQTASRSCSAGPRFVRACSATDFT